MAERWLLAEPGSLSDGGLVELDSTESHHAAAVLRLRPGDAIVLADGRGVVAEAVLRELTRGHGRAEVRELRRAEAAAPLGLTLVQGVVAGRGMDWAVQKAVEVGVTRLWPVVAGRSQLAVRAVAKRLDHWRRIARQALKQCHRAWELELLDPLPVAALWDQTPPGAVADPAGGGVWELPDDALDLLLVGPEGGLLPAEVAAARQHGWAAVRLAPHVLRAETAAVVGSAILAVERDRRRQAR